MIDQNPMDVTQYSMEMFAQGQGQGEDLVEIEQFSKWIAALKEQEKYFYETPHYNAQKTQCTIKTSKGEIKNSINFASYNYLGYTYHPQVIEAAKKALDQYGLGSAGSPVLNGTFNIHEQFEEALLKFYGRPDYGVTLFSSGYGTNLGVISAIMHARDFIVIDRCAHASIWDGALLSKANTSIFRHNDPESLETVLKKIDAKRGQGRVLVCVEGVYSADGDYGNLKEIIAVAKKYKALVLVDEAHSLLLTGKRGLGVSEKQDVLNDIDLYVGTFSKSFAGVGGCVFAKKELITYIRYFARSRMFSCAIDPVTTGGMLKVLELATGDDGREKRKRLHENADYFRSLLQGSVNYCDSKTWIVPVVYGPETLTIPVGSYLQEYGIDTSLMTYPAVPKMQARIRFAISSEHSQSDLAYAAGVIIQASKKFNFHL
jgi:glycine C-acetyltransferase